MATIHLLHDALELAELLRPAWAQISDGIPEWHPRLEDADKDADADKDGDADKDADKDADADKDGDKDEPDWKVESRKHERRAKAEKKRADDLAAAQKKRDDETKSEHEKAIDKAREEAKAEALTESQKERRADRLEVATTRLAARGVKVGEASVKFTDPEDAMVHIERAIRNGDVDEDEIFDSEGKVQTDALQTALSELLERKPHLKADGSSAGRASGSSDAGRGSGGGKSLDEMDVEEHLGAIKRHK